jgi:hypothetical protein
MKLVLIIVFTFITYSSSAQNYLYTDTPLTQKTLDCVKLLFDLIKTSDFKSDLMPNSYDSVNMTIDNKTDSILSFHLSQDIFNGEGTIDAMIAAFDINFESKQLLDVTTNPDKPKLIKYNKAVFEKIKPACF